MILFHMICTAVNIFQGIDMIILLVAVEIMSKNISATIPVKAGCPWVGEIDEPTEHDQNVWRELERKIITFMFHQNTVKV